MKKKCKGLLALWLAAFMMLSLASPVFAAGTLVGVNVYTETPDTIMVDQSGLIFPDYGNLVWVEIETDTALNTQEDLMDPVHPGLIQNGWNVWRNSDSGVFEGIENNEPVKLALGAQISQENFNTWKDSGESLLIQPTGTMRAFTHQPTESEPYVVVNDTKGVKYQWRVYESVTTPIYTTVEGETAATLSDWEVGPKYVCKATWPNGYTLVSNPVTFTKEPADGDNSAFWWMLYFMMNTKYEINAAATDGGTITPSGITKVKYRDSQEYIIKPSAGYVIKDVQVDGESVGAVGAYTFEKVTKNHTISAVFAPANPYTDINVTDSYYDAVMYLYQNGIMNGMGDGTAFGPDEEVDRAMLFTVLWRLHGSPVVNYIMPFTDVDADAYYAEAVRWAASIGILKGFEDNTFRPDEPLAVEQLCTVLYRYIQREGGGFKGMWMFNLDVKDRAEISDWAFEAMCYFKMKGIYVGEDGELNPQDTALRSQIAEMIYTVVIAED